jgi:hypothetical protein
MNVRELREVLESLEAEGNGELSIKFSYNYGDHWSTGVAADVDTVETAIVKYSYYHQMQVIDNAEEDFTPEDARCVVILR